MKTIAALQAWGNFSEYYSSMVGKIISDKYKLTITYNHDLNYLNQFDIVWAFFPQDPKTDVPKEKLVKTFWELHEMGWSKGKVNVACSQYAYRQLLWRDPNALYVPFGVDSSVFTPKPHDNKIPVVGWCGQEGNRRKQFEKLLALVHSIKEVQFYSNITKNFHGDVIGKYKTVPDVSKYYNMIDIYVCSSSSEGFGLPLLEASSCGIPIITFDVGIARELKQDGAGVIIVDDWDEMRDTIIKMAKDKLWREELGQMSRKTTLSWWEWARMSPRWLRVFDSI